MRSQPTPQNRALPPRGPHRLSRNPRRRALFFPRPAPREGLAAGIFIFLSTSPKQSLKQVSFMLGRLFKAEGDTSFWRSMQVRGAGLQAAR